MQEDRAFVVGRFIELVIERHGRDDPGEDLGYSHPHHTAHERKHQRFQQELQQNVPRARSNRLAQADLPRPLRDRDQHNIHHADSAHRQRNDADQSQHRLQPQRKSVDHGAVLNGVPRRRRLVVFGIEVMPRRLKDNLVGIFQALQIAHQSEGDEAIVVVRSVIHRVLNLVPHRSDHFKIKSPEADVLPHCRRSLKNFLRRLVAQNHHPAMVGKISVLEIAAVRESQLAHLPIGHFDAAHRDGHDPGAKFDSEVAINFAAHRANDRHLIANRFHVLIFVSDLLARALAAGLHTGLSRPKHNDVIAHVHKSMQHTAAQTLAVGEQQHHRSQSPHDAQHGEQGAHAVAHKRLPALQNEFFQEHGFEQSGQRSVASQRTGHGLSWQLVTGNRYSM